MLEFNGFNLRIFEEVFELISAAWYWNLTGI